MVTNDNLNRQINNFGRSKLSRTTKKIEWNRENLALL